MISAELWRRRFGADTTIVGRTVTLAAVPTRIIGVLPVGFQFPFSGVDVWVTRPAEWSVLPVAARSLSPILSVFGRLKASVDVEQASAELAVINRAYAHAHPGMLDAKPNSVDPVIPLKDRLGGERSLHALDAVRSGWFCAADRVLQCGEPVARACNHPFAGICSAGGARGRAGAG